MSRSALMSVVKPLGTLVFVVVVATILWQLLPKAAFSSDLSRVGQGKPALVMLRDIGAVGGERVLEQMHAVYPEFESQMIFLVVHTGNPAGVDFGAEHGITDGQMIFFAADGRRVARSERTASAEALRGFLNQNLEQL